MGQILFAQAVRADLERFLQEDDLSRNLFYTQALPEKKVKGETLNVNSKKN